MWFEFCLARSSTQPSGSWTRWVFNRLVSYISNEYPNQNFTTVNLATCNKLAWQKACMSAISLPRTKMDRLALCVAKLNPYCDLGLAKTLSNKDENETLQILLSRQVFFVEQWQQPAVPPPFSYCLSDRGGQPSLLKCVSPQLMICDGETHFPLMSLQWRIQFPLIFTSQDVSCLERLCHCLGHTTSICFLLSLQQLHTSFLNTDQHIWYAFYSQKCPGLLPEARLQFFLAGGPIELSERYTGSKMVIVDVGEQVRGGSWWGIAAPSKPAFI